MVAVFVSPFADDMNTLRVLTLKLGSSRGAERETV
jgi:hypothetical protein